MKCFYTLLFAVLAFMSLMQPVDGLYHKLTLVTCLFIIVLSLLLHKKIIIQNSRATKFFCSYIFFCVVAAGVNQDMGLLKNSLQLLCIFFAVGIFFNEVVKKYLLDIVLNGIILAYIPFFILCFRQNNFIFDGFAGVFENPNTMGFSTIGLAVVVLMRLYLILIETLNGHRNIKISMLFVMNILIYLFVLYVIMLSNARTSLLTVAIATLVMVFLTIKMMKKTVVQLMKFIFLFVGASLLLVFAVMEIDAMQDAFQSILLKMEKKSGNITDGRLDIWLYVFENLRFWGHGIESLKVIGMSHAHNTFVNILQETGILSLVFYVFFIVTVAKGTVKYNYHNAVFTTLVITAALGVSTFELLYFNVLHILVFVVSGFRKEKSI